MDESSSSVEAVARISALYGGDELETLHQLALMTGYEERVPTIMDFMTDPYYLGKSLVKANGTLAVWPCWVKELKEIFPNPYHITHAEVYCTGGIGIGKSTFAKIATAYCMCKMLCLRSPHEYYDLLPTTIIQFALLNATMGLGYEVLYSEMVEFFENSPFFKDKFAHKSSTMFIKNIDLTFGSSGKQFLGKAVPMALFSEINDATRKDQGADMFATIYQRLKSRFGNKGKPLPGFIILDSSNKGNKSFVDQRIEVKRNNGDTDWKLIRLAGWEARAHFGGYSGDTFRVYAGDQYKDPFIFDGEETPNLISKLQPERIIDVPVEHMDEFRLNLIEALRDMAGVSTFGTWSFLSSMEILSGACTHINPVTTQKITLDFFDQSQVLTEYLDVELLSFLNKAPRFIHIDLGIKTDSTGIGCSYLAGMTQKEYYDNTTGEKFVVEEPLITTEWVMEISATPGQEVPIYKIKDFILQARSMGYPIYHVSTDGYQSTDLRQQLKLQGIETSLISCDRTKEPYNKLRNGILEGRYKLPNQAKLRKELFELEENEQKFDHPSDGSKDIADGVAGSTYAVYEHVPELRAMDTVSDALDDFVANTAVHSTTENFRDRLTSMLSR